MIKLVYVAQRFAILELENEYSYYSKENYDVYVNDKFYVSDNKNIIGIYDLEPSTNYKIKVGEEEINISTKDEVFCLHTDNFNPYKDGINNDTLKLQSAILACPEGGTVYIDKGTYLITSLFLKSNINIYLDKECKLICEVDRLKFPVLKGLVKDGNKELNLGSFEGAEADTFSSIITGLSVKNVTIAGRGEIDGRATLGDWYQNHHQVRIANRPFGIFLNRCEDVVCAGFYIHDTACWNIHPYFSSNLGFFDLNIQNPTGMPTTDGIDPDSSENITILGCYFNVGDDCIAIKSGTFDFAKKYLKPCQNIVIRNCLMQAGHGGVVLGSESSSGINHLTVSNCLFKDTDRGLRIKTRRGRGRFGKLEHIIFNNIIMDNVLTPFVVNMFYNMGPNAGHEEYFWTKKKQFVDETTPYVGDFTFTNIVCNNVSLAAGVFLGLPEETIKSLSFKNVIFNYKEDAVPGFPVMIEHKEKMLKVGLYLDGVDKLLLDNVKFNGQIGEEVVINGETNVTRL